MSDKTINEQLYIYSALVRGRRNTEYRHIANASTLVATSSRTYSANIMDIQDNPNYYFTDRPYKPKLICSDCRKVFKRRLAADIGIDKEEDWKSMICPNCGKQANYVGPKFRAPKLENVKAWKSIEVLQDIGVLNFMGFATNRIEMPESTKGLRDLLTEMKADHERAIRRWVSHEYNEENKQYIKTFSEIIKRIDKYLEK